MTPKARRFIEEYLIDLSPKAAAERAGYKSNSAGVTAARLLRKPEIKAAIQKAMDERSERTKISQDNVLEEIRLLAHSNMRDYLEVDADGNVTLNFAQATREQFAAVGEVTIDTYVEGRGGNARQVKKTKFKLHDKLGALDKLARHLSIYNDKMNLGADQSLLDMLNAIDGNSRGLPNSKPNGKANGADGRPPVAAQ